MQGDTTEVVVRSEAVPAAQFGEREMNLLRNVVAPGISDDELLLFSKVCQRTGLDPFAKQIYALPRNKKVKGPDGKWRTEQVMSIQTSIDGLRLIAQRSGRYAGQTAPQWCGKDGLWTDVWLHDEPPAAARVGVYAKGFAEALVRVALWREYAQTYDGQPTGQWKTMPALMLAKTAEAQALRAAFPAEMSGVYTEDEMAQSDLPTPEPVAPAAPAPALAPPAPRWEEMMQALHADDPATNWEALVAHVVAQFYGTPPLSDEQKGDLRKRLVALVGQMDGITMGVDFPPPTVEQVAEAVAAAFDGLAIDVLPFVVPPPAPEEEVVEGEVAAADDIPFGADETKEEA